MFIPVSNLKQSTTWYEDMLGFKLLHPDEPLANTLMMGDGTVTICLVKSLDINQPSFPKNEYDVDHYINFHTKNIDEIYKHLLNKGANISEIHEFDGLKGFELYDPDGNRFSVVQ